MDNLTHSLVGALFGQAGLKKKTGLAMPALIFGANLPDIDGTCMVLGTRSLALRRGLTHGPIAWVILPLVLAGMLWAFDRWQAKRGTRPEGRAGVHFGWLYALALIACLTHPALDWLNSYGIRLLAPFSQRWFYGDTLFIADVWLWAILGLATWYSLRREKRDGSWRLPARVGLAAALAYIAANLGISRLAAEEERRDEPYPQVVIANPVLLAPWRREILFPQGESWWTRSWSLPDGLGKPRHLWLSRPCALPGEAVRRGNADLAAFLFWSRAPLADADPRSGGTVVEDARFAGRTPGGMFTVVLPDVPCEHANHE